MKLDLREIYTRCRYYFVLTHFKDCMSAKEVCDNMADALLHIFPNAQINKLPLADGGEGFVETISSLG